MLEDALFSSNNVFLQIKSDQPAPVYIINLLISDLIQLCYFTAFIADYYSLIFNVAYGFSLMASVGFMACISFER